MFLTSSNILGMPQATVQQTTSDWNKFLGRDTGATPAPNLMRPGLRLRAFDGIYGVAEFILAYGVASLAIGDVVRIGAGYATTRAVSASRGVFAISMAANTDTAALSWFCIWGQCPATVATHTVDTVSYTTATAGSVSSTDNAGGAIAGLSSTLAAGGTVGTKVVQTVNGSPYIIAADLDGLYVGMSVTGTGIAGGSVISSINQGGTMLGAQGISGAPAAGNVQLSANCTATGSVTGSFVHPATKATLFANYPQAIGVAD